MKSGGRVRRSRAALLMVLVSVLVGGYGTVALAAQPSP